MKNAPMLPRTKTTTTNRLKIPKLIPRARSESDLPKQVAQATNGCGNATIRAGISLRQPPRLHRPLALSSVLRSAELQLRAIANAPLPRRAGALRSDGRRAGVRARWRWNAKHITARRLPGNTRMVVLELTGNCSISVFV